MSIPSLRPCMCASAALLEWFATLQWVSDMGMDKAPLDESQTEKPNQYSYIGNWSSIFIDGSHVLQLPRHPTTDIVKSTTTNDEKNKLKKEELKKAPKLKARPLNKKVSMIFGFRLRNKTAAREPLRMKATRSMGGTLSGKHHDLNYVCGDAHVLDYICGKRLPTSAYILTQEAALSRGIKAMVVLLNPSSWRLYPLTA
ncbi:hypothetical protein Tco_0009166 [Tanacetum coccineum]